MNDPVAYSPETVLTLEQLAAWLQVGQATALAMRFRSIEIPGRQDRRRYLVRHILEDLDKKAGVV